MAAALLLASSPLFAQTPTKPAPKSTGASTAKSGTATHSATTAIRTAAGAVKLPPGVPPVKGLLKSAFALRYQDVQLGTGEIATPGGVYEVKYTGWLAKDGKKFDSSEDHPDKAPIKFPQGRGRVIPGWDQGFEGMKIGGKRRLFIPYQLAYGAMGRAPVIPEKADLIFDIELVSVSDISSMQGQQPMRQMPARPAAPPPPSAAPGTAPGTNPANPPTPPPPANGKPADPTAPTQAPDSAPAPQSPTAPSAPASPSAPDKPANPAQPN